MSGKSSPIFRRPARTRWILPHFVYVHSAQTMPKATIELDGCRRLTEMVTLAPAIGEDGSIDMSKTEDAYLTSRNWGPGMSSQTFDRAFKTVMMGTMTPITNNRLVLRFAFTKPKNISEQFNILTNGLIAEVLRQVGHDMVIWNTQAVPRRPHPLRRGRPGGEVPAVVPAVL